MNNTIRHLPNGDFEVIYPETPIEKAARETELRTRREAILSELAQDRDLAQVVLYSVVRGE